MTKELMRKGDRSLVLWETGNRMQFVTCTDYDPSKPEGSQWIWGHYFNDLVSAVNYMEKDESTYYEVVRIWHDGDTEMESCVETAWEEAAAKEYAHQMKDEFYPGDPICVLAYRYAGVVMEL